MHTAPLPLEEVIFDVSRLKTEAESLGEFGRSQVSDVDVQNNAVDRFIAEKKIDQGPDRFGCITLPRAWGARM